MSEGMALLLTLLHVGASVLCLVFCVLAHYYGPSWAWACLLVGLLVCLSASLFHLKMSINDFRIFLRGSMLLSSICVLLAIPLLSAS